MGTQETNVPSPTASVETEQSVDFPPKPITDELQHKIMTNYCKDMNPDNFHESGCAVCGALTLIKSSVPSSELSFQYLEQYAEKVTRKERKHAADPIEHITGPVIASRCKIVCLECAEAVKMKKLPKNSLANGLWLGEMPSVLIDLTFAEQTLISRVRINNFVLKLQSGMYKTKCNIIAFQNPVPQILESLPPPSSDLEETFAVMFIKSKPPTEDDFSGIPLYNVRRKKVQEALEWLKLNHADYQSVFISHENLKQYPENGPLVPIIYLNPEDVTTNKQPESTSVNDIEKEEGVTDGAFVGIVHGLSDTGAPVKTWTKLAGQALSHLTNNDPLLILGHTDTPETLFKNPTLYSSAFPLAFPLWNGVA